MAGLLYFPRLMVYHADPKNSEQMNKTFQIMEYKLLFYIATPAMLLALITGSWLAIKLGFPQVDIWLHYKILFSLVLVFFHHYLFFCRKKMLQNPQWKTQKFFRILNEAPTILMIIIVFLVIIKP